MNRLILPAVALLLLAGCSKAPETQGPPPASAPSTEIAWVRPTAVADVDRAFEQAKAANKPVFLFWTAAWCPPCNQVKSTIFTRPEFIAKSRSFVPVYVDGDTPSGQALGKRFSVSAYPTMVLLRPDGSEITRLAGSVEPAKYMQVLDHGIAGGSSAREALASALSGNPVSAEDWRLLAFYAWETDEQQMIPKPEVPATLIRLAQACPSDQREAASRLTLQAIAASATAKGEVKPAADKADALASVRSILARPELVREHYDLIAGYAADIVGYTTAPKSREREELLAAWSAALDRLVTDPTLSNGGRIGALSGKVDLARLDNKSGPLPAAADRAGTRPRSRASTARRPTSTNVSRSSPAPERCWPTPVCSTSPMRCCRWNSSARIRPTTTCSAWPPTPASAARRKARSRRSSGRARPTRPRRARRRACSGAAPTSTT